MNQPDSGSMKDLIVVNKLPFSEAPILMDTLTNAWAGRTFSQDFEMQKGIPFVFDKPPGRGASTIVRHYSRKWYMRKDKRTGLSYEAYADMTLGSQGEGRTGVVPLPIKVSSAELGRAGDDVYALEFPMALDLIKAFRDGVGLCFFDDMGETPRALMPVFLDGLQRRRIGTGYLGARVRAVGATNCPKHGTGAVEIPANAVNRCGWYPLDMARPEEIGRFIQLQFAIEEQIEEADLDAHEKMVDTMYPDAYSDSSKLVADFLQANSTLIETEFKQPTEEDERAALPYATPRAWAYTASALASAKIHKMGDSTRNIMVAGFVGQEAADQLDLFRVKHDLPNAREFLESVLAGTPIFKHSPTHFGRTHIVLDSCLALVTPKTTPNRDRLAAGLWKWADAIKDECADMIVPMIRAMRKAQLDLMSESDDVIISVRDFVDNRGK